MTDAANQDAAKAQYKSGLADLTFNSRPIIMTLTMIASENLSSAPGIVRAIQEQIDSVRPFAIPSPSVPRLYRKM